MRTGENATLTPFLKYLITIGCGVVVANLYYCQPILGALSRAFHVSEEYASFVNICSQMGYGLGLFFIVPLGDMLARRKLLIWMHLLAALTLLGFAFSPDIEWLYFFSVGQSLGPTRSIPFMPISLAATHS